MSGGRPSLSGSREGIVASAQHGRDLAPERLAEQLTDVEGRDPQRRTVRGPLDPDHVGPARLHRRGEVLHQVGRGGDRPGPAGRHLPWGILRDDAEGGDQRLPSSTTAVEGVDQRRIGHPPDPPSRVGCEHLGQVTPRLLDSRGELGLGEDRRCRAGQSLEPPGTDLEAARGRHDVLEEVGLVQHGEVVLGKDRAAARQVESVQVGVHDDHVRGPGSPPGLLGEAAFGARAATGPRALDRAHAHRRPGRRLRLEVQLGPITAAGVVGPGHQASQLGLGCPLRPRVEVELLTGFAQLANPLQADVVGATLEQRVGEGVIEHGAGVEVLRQERQVLLHQLVLEGLGRGGDDHPAAAQHGRDEVGEALAGTGPGLDDEVPARADRPGDRLDHLPLTGPVLSRGKGRADLRERVESEGGEVVPAAGHRADATGHRSCPRGPGDARERAAGVLGRLR